MINDFGRPKSLGRQKIIRRRNRYIQDESEYTLSRVGKIAKIALYTGVMAVGVFLGASLMPSRSGGALAPKEKDAPAGPAYTDVYASNAPAPTEVFLSLQPGIDAHVRAEAQASREIIREKMGGYYKGVSGGSLVNYIEATYEAYTGDDISDSRSQLYAKSILKYSEKYDLDPIILIGVIAHERHFVNADGDLAMTYKGKANPAEGICQINQATQKTLRILMNQRGMDISLEYSDLKDDPELAIEMAAFYLNYLRSEKGSLGKAIGHYNGGPGFMNRKYLNKVVAEMEIADEFFKQDHPGYESKKSLIEDLSNLSL